MEIDMMMKKLENEKLQLGMFIARGSFGAVYQGDYDGQKVAVKVLDFGNKREEEEIFKQEASLWSNLNHPNVAKFIGVTKLKLPENSVEKNVQEKVHWCMVSEFLEGGTLFSYLEERRKKGLPFNMIIRLALDMARGLAYLHSEKVVHRDVRLKNMGVDGEGRLKLINFGLSRKEASNPSEMTGDIGTELYMAPEVRSYSPYDHKCDVYSFGGCLWKLFYCRRVESSTSQDRSVLHLIQECRRDSERLPEMAEVVKALEKISAVEEAKAGAKRAADQNKFKGCFISFFRKPSN